ncbi:NAD(P)H-hydrate dehydratase [Desulfovibrio sp. OttesenSCG-928-O18]|nr:NAD(P)H-hydrate dehydratase [Desulfovibrio sp. OttesenSCG-928-O18]
MNSARLCKHLGTPLPTPKEMEAWDAASIQDFHIPASLLMENASREALHAITPLLAPESRVLVIMGGGNNGGDGACLARHLLDAGHQVLVCHTKALDQLPPAAHEHALIARKAGVPFIPLALNNDTLVVPPEHRPVARRPHMVIDALLGTGFSGKLREAEREIIRFMNQMGETVPLVSLDIPSGLDGLTGVPRPEAVRAKHTVTFEAAKTGLVFPHAVQFTGELHVRRIGIPLAVQLLLPPSFYHLAPRPNAWPSASPDMHKGQAGRVVIFGGSKGLSGAPALAALGALRAGAGLVTVACPGGIEPLIRPAVPEIMTLPFGAVEAWNNSLLPDCARAVSELPYTAALVVGPGMGRKGAVKDIVAAMVQEKKRPPIVLDADALFALDPALESGEPSPVLKLLREDDCITPHPGEAARMLGTTADDIQAARIEAMRALTRATKAVVVLKGAGTLIGRGDGPVFVAPFRTPSLAIGGSGDVLAGIIAAFMAQTRANFPANAEDAFRAVCLGVYTHGKAGEILDAAYPQRGALAREIAEAVPRVCRTCPE